MKLQRILNFAAVLFLGGAMAVMAQTPSPPPLRPANPMTPSVPAGGTLSTFCCQVRWSGPAG